MSLNVLLSSMKSNNNLPPGCLPSDLDQRDPYAELESEAEKQEAKEQIKREDQANEC